MTEFLLFAVHAPLASWGEIAVGEVRDSWREPSRSALVGLLGAALGVDRRNSDAQRALVDGYRVAVRIAVSGSRMVDYHTVRTVAATHVKRRKPQTRAELMHIEPYETLISQRTYRQNAVYTIAVWTGATPRWSLEALADALRRPHFVPYAGRRSNPLALPMLPVTEQAETLADAFASYAPIPDALLNEWFRGFLTRGRSWGREVAHDPVEGFSSGLITGRREIRRDVPVNRGTPWLFSNRLVEFGLLPDALEEQ